MLIHLAVALLILCFIGFVIQNTPLSPFKTYEGIVRLVLWLIFVVVCFVVLLPFVGINVPLT